ncbi:MAG: hypothetical protein AB2A00_19485 [Myxococcota bacterium]
MMNKVDPASAQYMATVFQGAQAPRPGGAQDAQITFSPGAVPRLPAFAA